WIVMAHALRIDQSEQTILPANDQQVCARQQERTAGPQIGIDAVERQLIPGREPVADANPSGRQLEHGVTIVAPAVIEVERTVPCAQIDVASIARQSAAGLPYCSLNRIRGGVEDGNLLQRRRVVAQNPSMVSAPVPL